MAVFIAQRDYDFLISSERFCEAIEKYSDLLGLSPEEVSQYKEDNAALQYVFVHAGNYSSCAESFIRYKTGRMRSAFVSLVYTCRSSSNYTMHIGVDLGIEAPVYSFGYN